MDYSRTEYDQVQSVSLFIYFLILLIKEHIPTHLTVSPLPCRQIFPTQDVGLRSCVRLSPLRATPPVDNVFFSVLSSRAVITLSFNWQESQTAISLPRCQLTPHWYVKFCHSLTVQSTIKSNPELIIRFVWSNLCKQVSFTVFHFAPQGGNDTTYVCANNNGSVQFFGAFLDNGVLTKQEVRFTLFRLVVGRSWVRVYLLVCWSPLIFILQFSQKVIVNIYGWTQWVRMSLHSSHKLTWTAADPADLVQLWT